MSDINSSEDSSSGDQDIDPVETREWLDAVEDVIDRDGGSRVHYLLDQSVTAARSRGSNLPFSATTAYLNSIPPDQQPDFPGDLQMEWRIRTINRWNAMACVVRRNKESSEYGGHIASFASFGCHVRPGAEPLLALAGRCARRGPRVLPGSCGAGDLRALVHGGSHHGKAARQLSAQRSMARV